MIPIPKQVIVVRRDLNMRKGKIAAQVAHASLKAILDLMTTTEIIETYRETKNRTIRKELVLGEGTSLSEWINGLFTKICVGCDSEKELLDIYQEAKDQGIICSLITDAGITEFHGVPTNTCIAIGPEWSEKIDKITGHLKLL